MIKLAYKLHRIISYVLFLQIAFWIMGGTLFSIIPFKAITKGGAVVDHPAQDFSVIQNLKWNEQLTSALSNSSGLSSISSHSTSQGLALKLQYKDHSSWIRFTDGQPLEKPTADSIQKFAQSIYKGKGRITQTKLLLNSEYHYLGLVDEMYGRTNVWQVSFNDTYATRLYFSGDTGEYIAVRNDYWTLYDAMWRLHIMDYKSGDDFNNLLLRIFAISALIFVISGIILSLNTVKRSYLKYRKKQQHSAKTRLLHDS